MWRPLCQRGWPDRALLTFVCLRGMPFLVVAAVVRGGAGCQGSTLVDREAASALTATTTPITTMCGEEGG